MDVICVHVIVAEHMNLLSGVLPVSWMLVYRAMEVVVTMDEFWMDELILISVELRFREGSRTFKRQRYLSLGLLCVCVEKCMYEVDNM